jgi:hypothetical protein
LPVARPHETIPASLQTTLVTLAFGPERRTRLQFGCTRLRVRE